MEEKIQYIYKTINSDEINIDNILGFIYKNNLKYSENNNGILFNLSRLDNDIINKLYDLVKEENTKIENLCINNKIMCDFKLKINKINSNKCEGPNQYEQSNVKPENDNFQKITISDIDQYIIELSKTPLTFT